MLTLYYAYLMMILLPFVAVGIAVTWAALQYSPELVLIPMLVFFLPSAIAAAFIAYWAPRYYDSITYELTADEVVVKHGVWWRMKHTVPYSRIMSIDIVQGPISRLLGLATVDIQTAGYSGPAGGSAGPGTRRSEASLIHVANPEEIREKILSKVRTRPLFEQPEASVLKDILNELRLIREALSRP